jgi:hypothetical protein
LVKEKRVVAILLAAVFFSVNEKLGKFVLIEVIYFQVCGAGDSSPKICFHFTLVCLVHLSSFELTFGTIRGYLFRISWGFFL